MPALTHYQGARTFAVALGTLVKHEKDKTMQKKKTFSTMEIVLLIVLIGSLILAFLQARKEEQEQ